MNSSVNSEPPAPVMDGVTKIFYDHIANGELYLQQNIQNGKWIFPPRELPDDEAVWKPASGFGTIYSWTVIDRVMHPAFSDPPYVIALVRLQEGPILMTRLLDADREQVDFDMAVVFNVAASKVGSVPFPLFQLQNQVSQKRKGENAN